MKKLLVVYNTCEIGGGGHYPWYANCVQSLLAQTMQKYGDDYQVAISGCVMQDSTMQTFEMQFGGQLSMNFIEDNVPLSVSFNDTVTQCIKHFGPFEDYLYLDSGISFWDPSKRNTAVEELWQIHKSYPNAITAAFPSNDDGSSWWGMAFKPDEDFVIPVGKATNMHCQIFSEEWRQAYGHILPDIFASNCMESIFANMAAALHRQYMMTLKIHVLHLHSLDGASIGSRREDDDRMPMSNMFKTPGMFYKTKKTVDEKYLEGYELGAGFEECAEYWRHDPGKFSPDGKALDSRLKDFWAREAYLKPEEFDYSQIRRNFIGR